MWSTFYSILIGFLLISISYQSETVTNSNDEQTLPNGYYAFARAPANSKPPKVRKPPYLPISSDCTGMQDSGSLVSNDNLCGNLNRGFIPRNPMGQYVNGEPYPFDLIKNKTLQFLSKTLPYLKEEVESIPKVARFVKPSEFFQSHSASNTRRYARQAGNFTHQASNNGSNGDHSSVDGFGTSPQSTLSKDQSNTTNKSSRQNLCEGNVICQALESLKDDGPWSKSFLGNVMSAVGNVANGNSLVSLLDQYMSQSNPITQKQPQNNHSQTSSRIPYGAISQLLSSVSSISESNNNGNGNPTASSSTGTSQDQPATNLYSPLLSIIDYIQSLQTPKYAMKRKTPSEPEDYLGPEGPEKPQTPCMSTEEYVSPTYARNYQGVWKYVVQIPNEGYFTQTVQQTTCLKSKCDLIEGSCRESPRWVSLLVAEIFYPNVYFPVNQIMPMLLKQQIQQAQQSQQVNHPQTQPTQQQQQQSGMNHYQVLNSNHNNNNKRQSINMLKHQMSKLDLNTLANMIKRQDQTQHSHPGLQNLELLARRARTVVENGDGNSAEARDSETGSDGESTANGEKQHCDGHDKIGCYIVRVYYDWFLVNGSCKCWKSSNGNGLNINETIKRIFIGKWKK